MTASFDRHGIAFQYPANWRVSDERVTSRVHCVTLQSPGSGFWMLQVVPRGEAIDGLVDQIIRSVQQEYEEVEMLRVEELIGATPATGFDLHFFCLDLLVCAQIRSFVLPGKTCVLLCQAEDHEFDRIAPVFLAITVSLIREATGRIDPSD
ncbi:MAG: hypothetical protein FJ276_20560 [Planctomycetes bacterium]|nr:hypothetical protein [Planctomycetota bacterium]